MIGIRLDSNDLIGNRTSIVFDWLEIMKFKDILPYNNVIFAYDQINENLPENFKEFFVTADIRHNYNTRGTTKKTIIKNNVKSTTYGLNSLNFRAASDWNQLSKKLNTEDKSKLIKSLREYIFNSYE